MSKRELKKAKEERKAQQQAQLNIYGDPLVTYNLSIGDIYMRTWTGEETNWEAISNDPNEFSYHPEILRNSRTLSHTSASRTPNQAMMD